MVNNTLQPKGPGGMPAAMEVTRDHGKRGAADRLDEALQKAVSCTCSNAATLFDPLTAREVRTATDAVKAHTSCSEDVRFVSVALWETDKEDVLRRFPGYLGPMRLPGQGQRNHPGSQGPCQACKGRWGAFAGDEKQARSARVVAWDKAVNKTLVYKVCLPEKRVSQVVDAGAVQPSVDGYEYELCEQIVKDYPPFQQALAKRNLDPEQVYVDAWCPGHFSSADDPDKRVVWPALYVRAPEDDTLYARPVEGIDMRIDMRLEKVVMFKDFRDQIIPQRDPLSNYPDPSQHRKDIMPINITQPQGPSFKVDGWQVRWQRWQFRVGFTSREGAVLHCLSYQDPLKKGEVRPVAYRISFAEMVVPYGDPKHPHYLKNAFDAGEDGLGKNAHSLVSGCDCKGEMHYFDVHMSDYFGGSETIEKAVCMHEEDFGILWKHVDWRTGHTEVRRKRRLVLSFICTVANYDYGFFYYLYQDGTIEFQVKLTGILSTGALAPGDPCKYGTRLTQDLYAPVHQHFFVVRMDICIDGLRNSVWEVDSFSEKPGPHNPMRNAFYAEERQLKTEREAVRDSDPATARSWKFKSSTRKNRAGAATAWKLLPQGHLKPMADPEAPFLRRAGFLNHHLWVTPYNPNELFPGGNWPNQNPNTDGLVKWTQQDRSLQNTDIVVWHVFGVHHVPRLEDYPIMPVEYCGFSLMPFGFFDISPAMDVPPEAPCHSQESLMAARAIPGEVIYSKM